MKFGNLKVTKVLYCAHQTSLLTEERAEHEVLISLEDEATGEKGHLFYYFEGHKRDFLHEESFTDNPRLFDNEHPEAEELQNLLTEPVGERNKQITDLILGCRTCSMVVYEEGQAGWGLYAKNVDA